MMAPVTFELQHRIDHMFEHFRPGDSPVLGHMADYDNGDALLFGTADQLMRMARTWLTVPGPLSIVADTWSGWNQ